MTDMPEETGTLYTLADQIMRQYIQVFLDLSRRSQSFSRLQVEHVQTNKQKTLILGGIDSTLLAESATPEQVLAERERLMAVGFDVEMAVTRGVYLELRSRVSEMAQELDAATNGFLQFSPSYISQNPHFLPILQRLANVSSKAELKRRIGSVSDNAVSVRAAEKLADLLNQRQPGRTLSRAQLLQSAEPTLEGIVRDLVGRVLLESIVANALDDANISYLRENEYSSLSGVVYDFRADFVIPNEKEPLAFIEVRKSSTRHASLYAKDKMFSAINWKGKRQSLLAILVVDGPWTAQTLRVMGRVFDYIIRIDQVSEAANVISAYIDGDKSKLKWLIDFSIKPA